MNTYVLRREYALQMPKSYVDIDMDEMEYVDGGKILIVERSIDKRLVSWPINAIGWYFTGGLISAGISKLSGVVAKIVGLNSGKLSNVIGGFTGSWFEFGTHYANYLDRTDSKPNNGRIEYSEAIYY
ncbi:hypothetical protein [Clostridium sp. UBA1652]|uniref:hypothetical protein n=1 Tax=Clostridium sp. UBA1652 TaxID=1946348 RepID=UPI00257D0E7D|nr:hypothetical protein [Clostridium sp. UBA1652]